MSRSWRLGTAFGIGIYVHWTFLLVPLYVLLTASSSGEADSVLFPLTFVAALFGCVVLHELGHALTARRFGIGTHDITLLPIGGVARLERMSEKPWEEFWIAVAGPAVNVAIAAVLALGLYLAPVWVVYESALVQLAGYLLMANIMLVVFNLIPAFPMDGGRVFRAVLTPWLGRLRATEIAAGLAVVIALGMFVFAIVSWHPFLLLGSVFVFMAGQQELAAVRHGEAMNQTAPRDVHTVDALSWANQHPRTPGFNGFTWDARARVWILWRNGRPIQAVSPQ